MFSFRIVSLAAILQTCVVFSFIAGGCSLAFGQNEFTSTRFYAEHLGVADSSWTPSMADGQVNLPDSIPYHLRPGVYIELPDSSDTRRLHLQMGISEADNSLLDEIYALDQSLPVPEGRTLVATGNRVLIQFGMVRSDSLFAGTDTLYLSLRAENLQGVLSPPQSMTLVK